MKQVEALLPENTNLVYYEYIYILEYTILENTPNNGNQMANEESNGKEHGK